MEQQQRLSATWLQQTSFSSHSQRFNRPVTQERKTLALVGRHADKVYVQLNMSFTGETAQKRKKHQQRKGRQKRR